jgi:hypothetical protein
MRYIHCGMAVKLGHSYYRHTHRYYIYAVWIDIWVGFALQCWLDEQMSGGLPRSRRPAPTE